MGTVHIEPLKQSAVRLSNRQFGQLRAMLSSPKATVSLDELSSFNQLTVGANKRRGFIVETERKDGVMLTWEGREVLRAFERADFRRQVATMRFSTFLSLEAHVPAELPARQRRPQHRERTVREFQRGRRAAA